MKEVCNVIIVELKKQVPELKEVAYNTGQGELPNANITYPYALVDIDNINYANTSKVLNEGLCTVEVELFTDSPSIGFLDVVKLADKVLCQLKIQGSYSLRRIGYFRNKELQPRSHKLCYMCRYVHD